jgi:hypothetical protein
MHRLPKSAEHDPRRPVVPEWEAREDEGTPSVVVSYAH